MAKKQSRKVILFLVEGASECTALEFIDKLNSDTSIKFYATRGDITSNSKVNTSNCIKKVNEYILNFTKEKNLFKKDIIKVIHILDTDGVYIPDTNIIEDKSLDGFIYTTNGIKAPFKENVIERNKNKRSVLEKLLITYNIGSIPYKLYYMSCNLEHVLHNRLENFTDEEKKELANEFADSYYKKENEFIDFINSLDFKVDGDYKSTWEFIKEDLNSINRYSNLWLFFEENKNSK